jgi:di/tricarboxylate transporter
LRCTIIERGNWIALMGNKDAILTFAQNFCLKLETQQKMFNETLHPARAGLCEAVIPPSSQLVGLPLKELHMKRNYNIQVLAVYRGKTVYRGEELKSLILGSGDTLGMFCEWRALSDFHKNPDFVVVTTAYPREEVRPEKVNYALFFFVVPFLLIILGDFPVSVGLLLGASGMIATGVLSIDEAYESVSWKSVFLMAALIPLGIAMQSTQTTDWLTQQAGLWQGDLPNWVIQCGLAVLSSLAAFALSAVGATIVLVPIAIDLAINVGADPAMYALIVAVASNNSFLRGTQQTNTLIAGPGGYTSVDFLRAGSGMTVLYWVGMLLMINLCFG